MSYCLLRTFWWIMLLSMFPLIFESLCAHKISCVQHFFKGKFVCAPSFLVCAHLTTCVRTQLRGNIFFSPSLCLAIGYCILDRLVVYQNIMATGNLLSELY